VKTEISASNGQRMLAMTVFSHTLSFFRSRALLEINDQSGAKVASDDIRWIVTVPAIWHDPAKQFMRQAAYQVRTLATADIYLRHKLMEVMFSSTFVCSSVCLLAQ